MKKSNKPGKEKKDNFSSKKRTYRGKKPGKKDYSEDSRGYNPDSRVCAGSKDNDPSWYALNPQLLRDAASFPYAWPLGNRLNVGPHGPRLNKGSLPGIMVMHWTPTVGYSSDGTSPINVASINTYTKIRHDNSGHANYDHADYMLYLMAMDSVYAFHSWMRRVYGVMLTYSTVNRYYPRAIVKAMGVAFDSLQANLADFRQYINTYAVKASALAVPAKMSIMTKHYWMSEGLYYDSNQDKPQTYLFNPLGFYQFGLSQNEIPFGKLNFKPLFPETDTGKVGASTDSNVKLLTLDDIVRYGDSLLSPIISDEDFGIMSGDTLKSFGVGGCYTLPVTEETYTVVPSYSPEVLDQIQNATFIGMPALETMVITQDPSIGAGWILTDPRFEHPWVNAASGDELPGQNAFLVNRFVTFEHGDIKPENTMEATRWTNISEEVTSAETRFYRVPTMGTEVMCVGSIGNFRENEDGFLDIVFTDRIYVSMNVDADIKSALPADFTSETGINTFTNGVIKAINNSIGDINLRVQMLGMFDRHPAVYLSSYIGIDQPGKFNAANAASPTNFQLSVSDYETINGLLFDVNYYTVLSATDLAEMSHIALLSEFDVTIR